MEIKTGYLYHIKDEYFDVVDDDSLMQNHEKGKKRPTYFTIKDKDFLWFIPISSKVDKYKKIIDKKIERYGFCNTIIIQKITTIDPISQAVLSQQMQEEEEINLLFNRILRLTRILDDKLLYVRNPLKKSNISLLLDGLMEACEVQSVKIIIALVMALNNFAGNERSMRGEIKELNTICYDFYEQ